MIKKQRFTAIIEQEKDEYVALCPEFDIASQGKTIEEATLNLKEAVELFLQTASSVEIEERIHNDIFITSMEIAFG